MWYNFPFSFLVLCSCEKVQHFCCVVSYICCVETVFMLFFYLVTQSVIWFLHCHLGLASCISNSTLSSSITSLFLCLIVTALYCFWVHLQNNFNKWILTLTCLSVCMEQLSFHLVDFYEISYWSFVLTSVVKIKVWLNSGKSNRHFSWRHM
jgi:heme/copper-type cytochrome/quinol oxidase subunit 4